MTTNKQKMNLDKVGDYVEFIELPSKKQNAPTLQEWSSVDRYRSNSLRDEIIRNEIQSQLNDLKRVPKPSIHNPNNSAGKWIIAGVCITAAVMITPMLNPFALACSLGVSGFVGFLTYPGRHKMPASTSKGPLQPKTVNSPSIKTNISNVVVNVQVVQS